MDKMFFRRLIRMLGILYLLFPNFILAAKENNPQISIRNETYHIIYNEGDFYRVSVRENGDLFCEKYVLQKWIVLGKKIDEGQNGKILKPRIAKLRNQILATWIHVQENGEYFIATKYYEHQEWKALPNIKKYSVRDPYPALNGNQIYLAYISSNKVYFKHYVSNVGWEDVGVGVKEIVEEESLDRSFNPTVVFYNNNPYLAWEAYGDQVGVIFVAYFNGEGWIMLDEKAAYFQEKESGYFVQPEIAIIKGTPYIKWRMSEGYSLDKTTEYYVNSWDGNTWHKNNQMELWETLDQYFFNQQPMNKLELLLKSK